MNDLLTYSEAAEFLSVPVGTLRRLVYSKAVPHLRLGARTVRFRHAELDAWVAACAVPADNMHAAGRQR